MFSGYLPSFIAYLSVSDQATQEFYHVTVQTVIPSLPPPTKTSLMEFGSVFLEIKIPYMA